ncbi:MAG: FAD-dependent oxidoreductase [Hyphomicrobiales bacterium]
MTPKDSQSVVIIGGSHAAAEAIPVLRQKGWEGRIVLIGDEPCLPYQRPPLSKAYYQGVMDEEKILIRAAATYEQANIEMMLGRRAMRIDRDTRSILLDDGTAVNYSKLILATGTRPRKLSSEGADLPNINYLKTLQDVDRIKSQLTADSRLLIVGAGYIGLEVAASAVKQGVQVTVLEAEDRVLTRVTSPVVSHFYERIHKAAGVDIRLGARLENFRQSENGTFAELADGDQLLFDCAVVGIGVLPNTELAQDAEISCDNGILVDEFTKTSDPNIYAVGDCSNHPSYIYDRRLRLESVPNAVQQAKTAAMSICGEDVAYDQVPWFWSDQYDVKLQTVGLLQGYDQTVVRGDPDSLKFAAFYLRSGRLIAMDAINSPVEFMTSKKLIAGKSMPDPMRLADGSVSMKEIL